MKHGAFGEAEQMSENNRFNVSVRLGTREPLAFNRYYSYARSELQIVIHGSAVHHMQERSMPIRENDVLLLHPGMQNYFTDGSDDFLLHRICYNSKVPPPAIFGEPLELFQHLYPGAEQPGYDPLVPVTHVPDYDHELYLNLILRLYYECTKKRLGHKVMVPTMFVELLVYLARGYNQNLEPGAAWRLEAPAAYLARHFDAPLDLVPPFQAAVRHVSPALSRTIADSECDAPAAQQRLRPGGNRHAVRLLRRKPSLPRLSESDRLQLPAFPPPGQRNEARQR